MNRENSKAAQTRQNKLQRLNAQPELGFNGRTRHICKDGLPSLSHGRPKGCYNPCKLFDGELLTTNLSVLLTRALNDYITAKAKATHKSKGDVIRECIIASRNYELRNDVDYIAICRKVNK